MSAGFKALSTWRPSELPKAIILADDVVVFGPFCAICGFQEDKHVHGRVQRGKNAGLIITACPPPNGLNPMDKRCAPCTSTRMGVTPARGARHRRDGLYHEEEQ